MRRSILRNVQEYRQANMSRYIKELIHFVRVPNNVYEPQQIQQNAIVLLEMMKKRGIQVEMWSTPSGRPLIYGELVASNATTTILIYGHYDGVPVEEDKWHSNPYEPVLRQDDRVEGSTEIILSDDRVHFEDSWRLYGRSVADSKNAIVALLTALDSLYAQGIKPAVNLKFLFDGEEEVESPSLEKILQEKRDKLQSDLVISASGETHQSGWATVELGIRGILQLDLTVYTMAKELHSGHFGNFAPNANMRLAQLLSSMKNVEGEVTIHGFYEDRVPLTEAEKQIIYQIPRIEEVIKKQFGIAAPEMKDKLLQELINLPTFNIRGMSGGYVGDSARNIIPREATAEIDIRLVKGMDPERTLQKIIAHLQNQGYLVTQHEPTMAELSLHERIVKVEKKAGFPATRTPLDSDEAAFIIEAVQRVVGEELVIMPTEGGSLPLYLFEAMGIPVIGLPTSNFDCNQHSHDENLQLIYLNRAIDIFASIYIGERDTSSIGKRGDQNE